MSAPVYPYYNYMFSTGVVGSNPGAYPTTVCAPNVLSPSSWSSSSPADNTLVLTLWNTMSINDCMAWPGPGLSYNVDIFLTFTIQLKDACNITCSVGPTPNDPMAFVFQDGINPYPAGAPPAASFNDVDMVVWPGYNYATMPSFQAVTIAPVKCNNEFVGLVQIFLELSNLSNLQDNTGIPLPPTMVGHEERMKSFMHDLRAHMAAASLKPTDEDIAAIASRRAARLAQMDAYTARRGADAAARGGADVAARGGAGAAGVMARGGADVGARATPTATRGGATAAAAGAAAAAASEPGAGYGPTYSQAWFGLTFFFIGS